MQPRSPSFTNIAEKLTGLSRARATGELIFSLGTNQWHLYFFLGRLLYATGGNHRVRRLHRAVMQDVPGLTFDAPDLKKNELWEYHLLNQGINQNQLTLTQAKSIIEKVVQEVLFTLVVHSDLRAFWLPKKQYPIALIEVNQSLHAALDLCKQWQNMGLEALCPDIAPIFKQPVSDSFSQLLDGKNTIWDIALQMKQSLISVGSTVQNLAHQGVLELLTIPDLPVSVALTISAPSSKQQTQPSDIPINHKIQTPLPEHLPNLLTKTYFHPTPQSPQLIKFTNHKKNEFVHSPATTNSEFILDSPSISLQSQETSSLVACVDDSHSDSLIMGDILTQAGYKFINIQDPVTALPILLEYKPSLIFLDLLMPIANGYEICTQIRRVSTFKNTPVIILTSCDGIIDRVRAKIVGSSGFLAKPITTEKVLKILQKHLPNPTPVQSTSLQTV
ncbi:response regulator [Brasilonema sp. UFV-L1]|uniref:response regulator n=1 Tax=Brasilonema sp. UFV-L1 TaxID=2234130 RepID=UPI00145F253C|nr:response regulator [Brasilonema sp. UFV-L1]NMG10865.1 response regulator [Brasilonema sp. UFV-L1]